MGGLCSKTSEQGAVRGRGAGVWVLHLSLKDSGPQGTQPLPWNQHLRCEDPDLTLSLVSPVSGCPSAFILHHSASLSGRKEGTAWGFRLPKSSLGVLIAERSKKSENFHRTY